MDLQELNKLADEIRSAQKGITDILPKYQQELDELKRVTPETASKLDAATKRYDDSLAEMAEAQKAFITRMDAMEAAQKRFASVQGDAPISLGKAFVESEAYKEIVGQNGKMLQERTRPFNVGSFFKSATDEQVKATFLMSGQVAGFVPPLRIAPVAPALRRLRIRDLIPVRPTTNPTIEYVQEVGFYDETATIAVSGITRTGSVATVTTSTAHGLLEGERVKILGANQSGYNGGKTVTGVPSSTTFTFAVDSGTVTPATGTITAIDLTNHAGAAGMVTEGSAKPESKLEFELKNATVQTIAHWLPVSRQALADVNQLQAYIEDRLLYGLAYREERQLLYGNGTTPNLQGLLTNPDRQTYSWSEGPLTSDTKIDALRRSMTQVQRAEYEATGIVLNPVDWEDIQLTKGSDGHYIYMNVPGVSTGAQDFFRLPVVVTNAINAGQALVGAFGIAATIWDREDAIIRISDSHSDFFTKNLIAILAEERIGLATYRPESFVDVTFDAAPT